MIFNKHPTPAPPKPLTATETLRRQLASRVRRRALHAIAGDINDDAAAAANRASARTIANNMAGGASPEVAASLARTLVGSLPSDAAARVVSEDMLQGFLDGGDLPDAAKRQLALYVNDGHRTFDPVSGELVSTRSDPPHRITALPPQWVRPDETIRHAQQTYYSVLEAAPSLKHFAGRRNL